MRSTHVVEVREAFIQQSTRGLGQISHLYGHQVKTIDAGSSVVVLDAPTGSGKTLAALARVINRKSPAIFIYPTNSLVADQVDAITDLVTKLGYHPYLISKRWDPKDYDASNPDSIDILHLTSETLDLLAGDRAKGTILERILKGTGDRLRIMLTNPDTLYLIQSGRYARHGLISEEILNFGTIVVDEFHLYAGPTLARLMLMLNEMRGSCNEPAVDIVFLSATHGDTIQLLRESYTDLTVIHADALHVDGPLRRKIRYRTLCRVVSQSRVMTSDELAREVAEEIVRYYGLDYEWTDKPPNVKVLGIFSSVIFAVRVAQYVCELLENDGMDSTRIVHQIHGLVPRSDRPTIGELTEAIVIGTSAIEVGIDFDVPFLVMEAHDLASFLQRFGRGGRRNPCETLMYVPQPMADRLRQDQTLTYQELVAHAIEAFREMPSYAGFLCSPQIRWLILSMAWAGSRERSFRKKREHIDLHDAVDYFKALVEMNAHLTFDGRQLVDVIGSMDDTDIEIDLEHFVTETLGKHSLARGALNSILAWIPGQLTGRADGGSYCDLDIFDLFRLSGHIESIERHWDRLNKTLRARYEKADPIFVAQSIGGGGRPRAVVTKNALCRRRVSVFARGDVAIRTEDPRIGEIIEEILDRRNLVFLWRTANRVADYRIPRVYLHEEDGAIVIGDWALVVEYIVTRRSRT